MTYVQQNIDSQWTPALTHTPPFPEYPSGHSSQSSAAADEAALSRLYAGIHFRSGVEGGKAQGQCVARKVLALKFKE